MRILVTGASGFLGYHLVQFLQGKHEVLATWNSHPVQFERAASQQLDFTEPARIREVVRGWEPEALVHAGAMTLTGICEKEPELARQVNVEGTTNILTALAELRTAPGRRRNGGAAPHLVHLSTDLVFNGRKEGGRYREAEESDQDAPDPLMTYGRTKLEAEQRLLDASGEGAGVTATILRSALIYGPPTAPSPCFLDWMITGIRKGEGALFLDEFRSPVYVEDLCAVIETACARRAQGIFHTGGPDRISRYDFGLLVAEIFGLKKESVRGALSRDVPTSTPRPADVSLDITKARQELDYQSRSAETGLWKIRRLGYYIT